MKRNRTDRNRRASGLGRCAAAVVLLLLAAAETPAQSEPDGTGEPDWMTLSPPRTRDEPCGIRPPGSLSRTALVSGGIVAAVVAVGILARRLVPGVAVARSDLAIHVLAQRALGPRGSLYVVQCGPRVLILGASATQLTTLAEIADPEEIEELTRPSDGRSRLGVAPIASVGSGSAAANSPVEGLLEKIHDWRAAN
jgi:flagellar biogenesis protein FliO